LNLLALADSEKFIARGQVIRPGRTLMMHGKGEIAGPCLTRHTFLDKRQRRIARNRFD
jgi:hypothetical protein